MRSLASWLQVGFQTSMTESTLNGKPYLVTAGGVSWVGANPNNARRRSGNLNVFDQWVIFALLKKNFDLWKYPEPFALGSRLVRIAVLLAALVVPTKMELRNAQLNAKCQARPALENGKWGFACFLPLAVITRRVRFALLIVSQAWVRARSKRTPMNIV